MGSHSTLLDYSITETGNTEDVASGLFIFCSPDLKTTLKGWSTQAAYFIMEINAVVQMFGAFTTCCRDGHPRFVFLLTAFTYLTSYCILGQHGLSFPINVIKNFLS